jgi:hypothetical protein
MTDQEFMRKHLGVVSVVGLPVPTDWWDKTPHRVFWARIFENEDNALGRMLAEDYLRIQNIPLHPQCTYEAQRILKIERQHVRTQPNRSHGR